MDPAQRKRAARIIIEGAMAKYGPHNKIKSIVQSAHHPMHQSLAGMILIDLAHLTNRLHNMQKLFKTQPLGNTGKHFIVHQSASKVGQLALGMRIVAVQIFRCAQLQNRIAQKLQPFIVRQLKRPVLV
jgi:hypothetical protein